MSAMGTSNAVAVQILDREYRIARRSDGAERWVHGRGRLDFTADGTPVRMIGTVLLLSG